MFPETRAVLVVAACAVAAIAVVPAEATATRFDIRANVKMMSGGGAALVQKGSFSGAPLGGGRVKVRTYVGRGRGSVVRFTLSNSRGTVRGTGNCAVDFKGSLILYRGTAKITGGTGAFSGMRGRGLRVSGRGELSGERFSARVTGNVS